MSTLDEIDARLKAATPGPWRVRDRMVGSPGRVYQRDIYAPSNAGRGGRPVASVYDGFVQTEADAALIAHAPEDLRALLAVAWAARDACRTWCGDFDDYDAECSHCILAPITDALASLLKKPS